MTVEIEDAEPVQGLPPEVEAKREFESADFPK